MATPPPIRALYVHVPFCRTICGYCDFFSVVYDPKRVAPLVDALLAELADVRRHVEIQSETIFVGGGTPTTLPPKNLARLLAALRETAAPGVDLEFSVEANPATVTSEKARVLVDGGVNRVSIGAQTFDTSELKVLDRIHRPKQVGETVAIARDAGIEQVNLDLIFAVPGQSMESWLANLQAAIDLDPDHLSCYALTYEHGTPLYDRLKAGQVARAEDDLEARMYETTIDTLSAAGYEQYEISNFAKPGCECLHNLVYWRNESYVGIGPSAAGYQDGVRYKNVSDLARYIEAIQAGCSPRFEEEQRSPEDAARESMMLELRLRQGVDRRRFAARFGDDPAERFREAVDRHVGLGLLETTDDSIRLTRAGLLLADSVVGDFL